MNDRIFDLFLDAEARARCATELDDYAHISDQMEAWYASIAPTRARLASIDREFIAAGPQETPNLIDEQTQVTACLVAMPLQASHLRFRYVLAHLRLLHAVWAVNSAEAEALQKHLTGTAWRRQTEIRRESNERERAAETSRGLTDEEGTLLGAANGEDPPKRQAGYDTFQQDMTTLRKESKALAEASTTLERRSQDASDKAYMCVARAMHAYAVDLLQPSTWSEATITQACQQEHATRELLSSGDEDQCCGEAPTSPSARPEPK